MNKSRVIYAIVTVTIILLGLISRKLSFVPLFIGDFLWASMVFFMFRMIFTEIDYKKQFFLSLGFCYFIEISQLYQENWINAIRNTLLGSLVLGHGFLWSDLLAYTFGIAFAATADLTIRKKKKGHNAL